MNFAESSLAELAINIPMASQIFRKNRLDFCCGGKISLKEACEQKNLDLKELIAQLAGLENKSIPELEIPLKELPDYIVQRYHEDLRKRLPELILLSQKVERVHGDNDHCPNGLTQLLTEIQSELFTHMMKEENILFPLIKSGRGHMALMPVKVMSSEHEAHGRQLEELHRLTNDFTSPAEACPTWRALYKGLEKLEEELMEHIHLENNVLFPTALMQEV